MTDRKCKGIRNVKEQKVENKGNEQWTMYEQIDVRAGKENVQ